MTGDTYKLINGFWIKSKGNLFDLGLDENFISIDCSNFSYVSRKFIVIKRRCFITIFSITPIEKNGKKTPAILAKLYIKDPNIFFNFVIEGTCYTIDKNCQVKTAPARSTIYPKTT